MLCYGKKLANRNYASARCMSYNDRSDSNKRVYVCIMIIKMTYSKDIVYM